MESSKKIDNYIFDYNEVLGRGSYGTVYKGRQMDTENIVAIKQISSAIFSQRTTLSSEL
jgi:serine/threonine protein kinase